jgi:hypothetical protein
MIRNSKGSSLIIAIFIIVILAFMGVMFVSLINTSTFSSINDLQSMQALFIAEGGLEFESAALAPYTSWYGFATDPITTNKALGSGAFTVTVNVPATTARRSFGTGATVIRVFSVDRFPTTGSISIGVGGDVRTYAGTATNLPLGPRFTGVQVPGAAAYLAGTVIYPALSLQANVGANDTTIPFIGNSNKFLQKGTLLIDDPVNGDEEITYSGIQTVPALAFIGCVRGVNGTVAVAHNALRSIVPLRSNQEALLISSGVVGNAGRTIADVVDQPLP